MTSRIDYYKTSPDAVHALMGMEHYVNQSSLDKGLLNLVKLRASQINGCAYCVDLHSSDALKAGESERRLHTVSVWHESPFFSEKERAAFAWTEAVTLLSETHAPDETYLEVLRNFTEKESVELTMAIITINAWNRIAVSFRKVPGL